ncbi:MAG: EamA family transporter [Clostridia bacterium]|nr:EamA family transporter [Clostridia bacterium]MDD6683151.1 EamA family transporter [Clostridiales bacterium]
MAWVWLVLVFGVLRGVRELMKKKAIEKSSVMDVLFFYTLISFLLVVPDAKNAMGLTPVQLSLTALKAFVIFIAWMCGFYALERMPVSLYGVLDLSRMLFSTLLGVIFVGETMALPQIIGLILVSSGLVLLKAKKKKSPLQEENVSGKLLIMALACCLLNSVSGTMDKILMRDMLSSQLQFWYMLFLVLWYGLFMLVKKIPFHWKESLKNPWIWLLSILFVIGDRALFIANSMEGSRITVMTLIKQSGCIVTIIGGRIFFHEKNTLYKLICAGIILAGIVIAVI